jgi:NAD(P)-dependent dehydrogenase (short-subunit alcohol dehydrogenase family)
MEQLDLFSLTGRVALVTGASRGIGQALAIGLAGAGATVVGTSRSLAPSNADSRIDYQAADVTDGSAVDALLSAVVQRHGRLDILVNAAGVSVPTDATHDTARAAFRSIVNTNLQGAYNCCVAAHPLMVSAGGGAIVNVTSINSVRGFPGNPGYVASKGALAALTRALAVDWGPDKIRVNALAPGYIHTAMTECSWRDDRKRAQRARHTALGRWGETGDLVGAAIFLASDAAAYVTGQELYVDGGWTAKGMSDLD